jgi:hypothetical protein
VCLKVPERIDGIRPTLLFGPFGRSRPQANTGISASSTARCLACW